MSFLTWLFLTLATFRITRFITTDDLTQPIRHRVEKRMGSQSNWFTLINCNWCVGIYITALVFSEYHYLSIVPIWVYAAIAASSVVGYLGIWDD